MKNCSKTSRESEGSRLPNRVSRVIGAAGRIVQGSRSVHVPFWDDRVSPIGRRRLSLSATWASICVTVIEEGVP